MMPSGAPLWECKKNKSAFIRRSPVNLGRSTVNLIMDINSAYEALEAYLKKLRDQLDSDLLEFIEKKNTVPIRLAELIPFSCSGVIAAATPKSEMSRVSDDVITEVGKVDDLGNIPAMHKRRMIMMLMIMRLVLNQWM